MNTVLVTISDEDNLRARLKVAAAKRGETMTMLATNALEAVVSREERNYETGVEKEVVDILPVEGV